MSEPYDTASVVRSLLDAEMGRVRFVLEGANTPVVACVFSVTVEIDGVGPVNVASSFPADDADAAIELSVSTAKVMRQALGDHKDAQTRHEDLWRELHNVLVPPGITAPDRLGKAREILERAKEVR